jgi:hypothetical protein
LESSDFHGDENSLSFIALRPLASIGINNGECTATFPDETREVTPLTEDYNVPEAMNAFLGRFKVEGADKKVCGLPPSTRMSFEPVNPVVVHFGRPNDGFIPIDITSAIRVRGDGAKFDTHPKEPFLTDSQGCVTATLDIGKDFKREAVLDRIDQVMAKHPRGVQLRFKRW